MSIDQNFGKPSNPVLPSEEMKEYIVSKLKASGGLYYYAYEEWGPAKNADQDTVKDLKEIPTYEEILKRMANPDLAKFILENSDSSKVEDYNELVALFNTELPGIKTFNNYSRAKELAQEIFLFLQT